MKSMVEKVDPVLGLREPQELLDTWDPWDPRDLRDPRAL